MEGCAAGDLRLLTPLPRREVHPAQEVLEAQVHRTLTQNRGVATRWPRSSQPLQFIRAEVGLGVGAALKKTKGSDIDSEPIKFLAVL